MHESNPTSKNHLFQKINAFGEEKEHGAKWSVQRPK